MNKPFNSHIERLLAESQRPPAERYDEIIGELACALESDIAGQYYVKRVDELSPEARRLLAQSTTPMHGRTGRGNEFHVESQSRRGGELSNIASPDVQTLLARINPYESKSIAHGQWTDEGQRRSYLIEHYVAPLTAWFEQKGAQDFEIGLKAIPNPRQEEGDAFLLRVSIDQRDKAAAKALDQLSAGLTRSLPPQTQGFSR